MNSWLIYWRQGGANPATDLSCVEAGEWFEADSSRAETAVNEAIRIL
jgi:hypothetical protein